MLSYTDSLLFRPQTSVSLEEPLDNFATNCVFLPANFYPIQSPGYTAHWNRQELRVVDRSGDTAKIVVEIGTATGLIDSVVTFDSQPPSERRKRKRPGKGFIGNLTGWFRNSLNWTGEAKEESLVEIVTVLPLMADKTLFDCLVVIKKSSTRGSLNDPSPAYGFTRIRQLMTGNFRMGGRIDKIDAAIPALEGKEFKFVHWKQFLLALSSEGSLRFIDLTYNEAEWDFLEEGLFTFGELIVCEDKSVDSNQLVLLRGDSLIHLERKGSLLKCKSLNHSLKQCPESFTCGYIENGNVYVIQGHNLYKLSLKDGSLIESVKLTCSPNFESGDLVYLFPWRQDFKVSSLMIYLIRSREEYRITVVSVTEMHSEIVLESEWFRNDSEICGLFASSSLEVFLLDRRGDVMIYAGLLLNSDWQWRREVKSTSIPFEFANWFNILGEFPFKPTDYYQMRRNRVKTTLFIDDFVKEKELLTFPPVDWKSLGQACLKLKDEKIDIILYYLLSTGSVSPAKLSLFYSQFVLCDKQVAAIEVAFAADHGEYARAIKTFCTRKLDEAVKTKFFPKLVKMVSEDFEDCEELTRFILYASGRLVSLDLLFDDTDTFDLILRNMLKNRRVGSVLEWIKGLFAWLRPDERCALIPVAVLHQTLLKKLLEIILRIDNNEEFKRIGHEFVDSPFDSDALTGILGHLKTGNYGDRAAWLITMICASRGRLHCYLLDFDFEGMVSDREVLVGIEAIKNVLRPLVSAKENFSDDLGSPLNVPETPQKQLKRSGSSVNLSSSKPRSNIHNNLVNIYARTPSSPNSSPSVSIPRSPTFTPRHFPPRKPTSLLSSTTDRLTTNLSVNNEEEEADPFKADLINFGIVNGSKLNVMTDILSMQPKEEPVDVVMLTKPIDSDSEKFESVIKVKQSVNAAKRRRRGN